MRILQIAHGVYPLKQAGVEVYTHALTRELLARGQDVLVAAPGAPGADPSPDIPVAWLPARTGGGTRGPGGRARLSAALRDTVARFRPDIIHVQHLIHLGSHVLRDLERLDVPYVVSLPDYWFLCPGVKRMCGGSAAACARTCEYVSLSRPLQFVRAYWRARRHRDAGVALLSQISAPLLAISRRTADIHAHAGVARGRMIVHTWGIDTAGAASPARARTDRSTSFGYVGTVIPEKGVHVLVRAFQQVRGSATLHIYGDGPPSFLDRLRRLACGADVRFHGAYDHADLTGVLQKLDVVVVPSIWEEAYGLVAVEALAAEKVLIASDTGGLGEIVVPGANGFLVPPGDEGALARRMTWVAEHLATLRNTLDFQLNQRRITTDAAEVERIYDWTIRQWRALRRGERLPIEAEWDDLTQMLAEYLHEDAGEVGNRLRAEWRNPGHAVRVAWNRAQPRTEAEIAAFYEETDAYLYDLLVVHRQSERYQWRRAAASLLKQHRIRTLLDFGGGCGDDVTFFSQLGVQCTLFDRGRLTGGFARFRSMRGAVPYVVVDTLPETKRYDAVYCTEVLEHVPDPMRAVAEMHAVLRPGGLLIVTHSFELTGPAYPSHLEQHRSLARGFASQVEALGFELHDLVVVPGNRFFVFQKAAGARSEDAAALEAVAGRHPTAPPC